ncbi:uncharacterized protein LOC131253706 [Magnolia sinica]|uniref:uncharacterized protein LOC131253706 n=1 Tax=Magnolia sinica TaxID=86752 RepID=UPI00265A51BA|nr:uncharacterized protein LOC131253706 [Magnolia sinica]
MAMITVHKTLILLLLFLTQLTFSSIGSYAAVATVTPTMQKIEFLPAESAQYRVMENNTSDSSRRRLAPFQLCLLCRCCAANSAPTNCATMPCCFGIDCQLPDKPFGTCAFVPKSCNCTSCAM